MYIYISYKPSICMNRIHQAPPPRNWRRNCQRSGPNLENSAGKIAMFSRISFNPNLMYLGHQIDAFPHLQHQTTRDQ